MNSERTKCHGVEVCICQTQADRAADIVTSYVGRGLRGDNPALIWSMLQQLLSEIPIEDLYRRDYLIATGEALVMEVREGQ